MNARRIAVIGAGLGGLSAAARLAADGHTVDVYDGQSFPGGKAGSERIGAFRFDTGPSLVTMPEVFDQLFEETGESRDDYISLEPLGEICRYHFPDGSRLASFTDRTLFGREVERHTTESSDALNRFLEYSAKIYEVTSDLFLRRSLHEFSTFRDRRALRSIFSVGRIDPLRSMDGALRSFFKDPRMVQFFNRYATYNGSDPFRTPATLNIIPHVEYGIGAMSAVDGVYSIPRGLARLAEAKGARLHLSTRVEAISLDRAARRVRGIEVNGERILYDVVISNADVVHTYRDLLKDERARMLKRYLRLEPSSSGLVFLLGMKRSFPDLGLHNIFFSSDYRKEFREIFSEHRCPEDPTVYLNITSKTVPGDAPEGGENWFVLVNAPPNAGQDWRAETSRVRRAVLRKIEAALGSEVESYIEVETVMTPADIEKRTGSRFGSLYGISSNTRLAAFLRHPNRSRRHRGLFFCGGSAHPGGGMPLVVLSGRIAADLVRREIERGNL